MSEIIFFIQNNLFFCYTLIFFVAFFWSLFPFWIILFSEIVFVVLWILAGLWAFEVFNILFILYIWWIFWDLLSYYFWYKYWSKYVEKFINKKYFKSFFRKNSDEKYLKSLEKNWWLQIFLWRILLPFSHISAFISWQIRYNFFIFFIFDLLWILFYKTILFSIWFFFWTNYENIFLYIHNYIFLFFLIIICIIFSYLYLIKYLKIQRFFNLKNIKSKRKLLKWLALHISIYTFIILIIYLTFLYFVYFNKEKIFYNSFNYSNNITNFDDFWKNNLDILFIWKNKKAIQPINFIIITNKNIEHILEKMWRQKNKIMLKDKISLKEYMKLYEKKTLPIINLSYLWKNQDFGFQEKSWSNKQRLHLRWWNYGKYQDQNVYLISISKDIEFDINIYNNFITPIHEIEKNVDLSRDLLYTQIKQYYSDIQIQKLYLPEKETKYYKTDWIIYIVKI